MCRPLKCLNALALEPLSGGAQPMLRVTILLKDHIVCITRNPECFHGWQQILFKNEMYTWLSMMPCIVVMDGGRTMFGCPVLGFGNMAGKDFLMSPTVPKLTPHSCAI